MAKMSSRLKSKMSQTKRARRSPGAALGSITRNRYGVTIRTGARQFTRPTRETPYPEPPQTWQGTLPEWAIFWALRDVLKRQYPGDFEYLYFFDTGMVFDFFVFAENVGIEVQGLYWHYSFGGFKILNDLERKARAETNGFLLIFIDEDDALRDPVYFVREALSGRDHSRVSKGM